MGQPSKEAKKAWAARNKHKLGQINRRSRLRREYGITLEQYQQIVADQGNRCEICKTPFGDNTPFVDHDHATRWVRGLLCGPCNTILGLAKDDPEVLETAARYVIENATPTEFSFQVIPNPKRQHTEAWKQAASERHKGNKYKLGISPWNKGIPWPEETRLKMSASARSRWDKEKAA